MMRIYGCFDGWLCRALASGIAILLVAGLAEAQSAIWQRNGTLALGSYPYAAVLQDINGDGINDVLAWAPGYVSILSGADGAIVREPSPVPCYCPLVAGTLGDVDADGAGDYMVFSQSLGMVDTIISGASGSALGTVPWYGTNGLSGIGDVNGDGFGDFAVGILGMVEVYAGPSGAFLYRTFGPNLQDAFGTTIAPLGDVDQDGVPDFLVGAPGLPLFLPNYVPGWAHIVSGVNGAIIRTWTGSQVASLFGNALVSPGDVDGDGIPDVLVGATAQAAQRAILYSGATGSQLALFQGSLVPTGGYASRLAAPGDVDADGIPDLAIHTELRGLEIRSGATSDLILSIMTDEFIQFAWGMSAIGDVDGDRFPDLLTANPPFFTGTVGSLIVHSLRPRGLTPFGAECVTPEGFRPRIGGSSVPRLAQPFTINLSQVTPGREAFFCAGFSDALWNGQPLPMDLTAFGAPGCSLYVSIDDLVCLPTWSAGAKNGGAAGLTFQIPAQVSLSGLQLFAQWFVANPPGSTSLLASSAGLAIQLQP